MRNCSDDVCSLYVSLEIIQLAFRGHLNTSSQYLYCDPRQEWECSEWHFFNDFPTMRFLFILFSLTKYISCLYYNDTSFKGNCVYFHICCDKQMLQFQLQGHSGCSPLKFCLNVSRRDLRESSYFFSMQ